MSGRRRFHPFAFAWIRALPVPCCLLFVLLAGCGETTGTSLGTSTPSTSTSISPTATKSSATLNGCPGPSQTVTWPTPPASVISLSVQSSSGATSASASASVPVGQSVLIQLSAHDKWTLTPEQHPTVLALDQPACYYDARTGTCDWHLTARQTGSETLIFLMSPLCPPGAVCAQYVVNVPVSLTVTG